eukprot:gene23937-9503_t
MHSLARFLCTRESSKSVVPLAVRSFSSVTSAAAKSPFLRFSTPDLAPIDHSALLATVPETQITTLPNGLRVATETIPFAETTTVGVWINSGSRFENDANNGVAHFLEHILFKGTKRRSVRELEVEVEDMGGHLNAYTGREQTCYYAKVLGKDLSKGVDILSDIIMHSLLDERAINRERDVILREMEEVNKQMSELVFDHLHATAFNTSPLGRTILGPVKNIKSINREQIVQYIKTHYRGPRMTHYRGPRMVLAAAGAVDHDELEPSLFTGSAVRDQLPDSTECSFAVAFKGASWTDPDSISLMVMQTMIGGWDRNNGVGKHGSSALTQAVANEGLAHAFMAFNTNYHDSGLFGIYGVTEKDRCQDFAAACMTGLTQMCYEVSETDLTRAKNQLKASMMFFQDSSHHVAESIGRELLVYGRRMPKAELFARIDAVDSNTDMAVAFAGDVEAM